MAVEFACSECGKHLRAPDDAAGRKCRCPDCGTVTMVPDDGPPPLPSAVGNKADVGGRTHTASRESVVDVAGGTVLGLPKSTARIVGGILGVGVIAIAGIGYYGYSSSQEKMEQRDRLILLVDAQIDTAADMAGEYDFASAKHLLLEAATQVEESPYADVYLLDELNGKIDAARDELRNKEQERREQLLVEQRDRVVRSVGESIGRAAGKADEFDFAAAKTMLKDASGLVANLPYKHHATKADLNEKVAAFLSELDKREAKYREKVAKGWVVFEGRLIPGKEKGRILTERKRRQEELDQQRREEEARRYEAARRAEQQRKEAERRAAIESLKETAYVMSQEFVKRQLKAPSSARFPAYSSSGVFVTYDEQEQKYSVLAWVEAKNPFGVYLHSNYICRLWPEGGDNWRSDLTTIN